ncbi:chemotaxis protein [Salipiger aestuarii]|nr:chemotaxis protein [Salipiger aestuarii]
MVLSKISLKARLVLSLSALLVITSTALVGFFVWETRNSLVQSAQERQDTSLRILVDQFSSQFPGITATQDDAGRIDQVQWPSLPEISGHGLIDRVGAISGETATLFGWVPEEGDFIRMTTNIIKPDGNRAVGTWLGTANPVHAAMLRKETFRGEAVILGKPYFTIYEPITNAAGEVVGIFYVGVDKSKVNAELISSVTVGVAFTLFAAALGIALMLLVLSRSLGPLWTLCGRLEQMANGDLDLDVPSLNRKDEIGVTARVIEEFRQKLAASRDLEAQVKVRRAAQDRAVAALRAGLERLAHRDLGARIEVPDEFVFPPEYEALRDDFDTGVRSLAEAMREVSTVTDAVRGAAEEIGSTSDDLARRVEDQAATLERSAAQLDALAGTSTKIAGDAASADTLAGRSRELSHQSEQVLRQAIAAITRIEQAAGQINQIVTAIDDISFQTNLLALNAGVEAARAGEAGRGFAVVASEVRSLAQTAAEAAQEIKHLIRASNDEVREGATLVQKTGSTLGELIAQVNELGTLISDISSSVQTQTKGLGEINEGVQRLEGMTQHNAAVVEELNASGQGLNAEAHRLSDTVAVFTGGALSVRRPLAPAVQAPRRAPATEQTSSGWDTVRPTPALPAPKKAAIGTEDGVWEDF